MNAEKNIWDYSLEEIIKGYIYDENEEEYHCLVCNKTFKKGLVYVHEDILCEAEQAAKFHINSKHGSMFSYLINSDNNYSDLTEQQRLVMEYFYNGLTDSQISTEMDGISNSTIRKYRFMFHKKEKQAKIFLALMSLMKRDKEKNALSPKIRTEQVIEGSDDYDTEILNKFIDENKRLITVPKKLKDKLIILRYISSKFEKDTIYSEVEVNEIVENFYEDITLIRRLLIDFSLMERTKDGSSYRL